MPTVASRKKTSRKAPPSGKGLTFEKVWALMQEIAEREAEQDAKRKKELDRWMKKNAEQHDQWKKEIVERETEEEAKLKKEFERWKKKNAEKEAKRKEEFDRWKKEIAEQEAERKKELEQILKENAEGHKELERIVRRNGKQLGEVHRRFGQLAEHLVAPGIAKRFNELGYHFDLVGTKGTKLYDGKNGKIKTEIDLFMENVENIMAIEVKSRPVVGDVEHHIKRLEILRDHYRGINDRRKILGGIAGAIYEDYVKKAAREAGLFVIEQSGDTMKIDMPDGFIPREW